MKRALILEYFNRGTSRALYEHRGNIPFAIYPNNLFDSIVGYPRYTYHSADVNLYGDRYLPRKIKDMDKDYPRGNNRWARVVWPMALGDSSLSE